MMRKWTWLVLSTSLLGAFALSPSRVAAADITDLADAYSGPAHSTTDPAREDSRMAFAISNRQQNGRFTLTLDIGGPLQGKVSSKGRITFGGSILTKEMDVKVKGSGQLSATGQFITGQMTIKGRSLAGGLIDDPFFFDLGAELALTGTKSRPRLPGLRR